MCAHSKVRSRFSASYNLSLSFQVTTWPEDIHYRRGAAFVSAHSKGNVLFSSALLETLRSDWRIRNCIMSV
jgi:hypothetical protein